MTSAVESGFAMLAVAVFLGFIGFAILLVKEQTAELSSGTSSLQQQADLNYLLTSAKAHARWHLKQSNCSGYSSLASKIGDDQYSISFSKSAGSPLDVTVSADMSNGQKPVTQYTDWTAYDSTVTEDIQITDMTYVDEDQPTINFFGGISANASGVNAKRQHVLLKFSTSAIPANGVVQKAELKLTVSSASGSGLTIERIVEDWTPAEVTWNKRDDTNSWSVAGGVSTGLHYNNFDPTSGTVTLDITALFREWHAGTDNYGLLISYDSVQNANTQFVVLSGPVPVSLVSVSYVCACGDTCATEFTVSCDADIRPNTTRRDIDTTVNPVTGLTYVPGDVSLMGVTFPSDGGYVFTDGSTLTAVETDGTQLGTCALGLADTVTGASFITTGPNANNLSLVTDAVPTTVHTLGSTCTTPSGNAVMPPAFVTAEGITALTYPGGSTYSNHFAVTDAGGNVRILDSSYNQVDTITPGQTLSGVYGLAHIPNQDRLLLASEDRLEVVSMAFDGTIHEFYDTSRFGATTLGGLSVNLETCDHALGRASLTGTEVFETPLSLSPLAHWQMDDLTGSVATESINGYNGNVVGLAEWDTSGAVQGALQLDGSEYATVPHNDALNLSSQFSIAGWVYPDFATGSHVLISKGHGTIQNFWLGYLSGELTFIYHDGAFQRIDTGNYLSAGQWYHLAATYSTLSGRFAVYLNGAEVAAGAVTADATANTAPILLGSSDSGGDVLGKIDDIRLFAGEMTAADVALLHAEGVTGPPTLPAQSPPGCTLMSFADNFQSASYAGSTGTEAWSSSWSEVGESTNPTSGDVRLLTSGSNVFLRLQDNDNGGEGVVRSFDLTSFADATLTYDYARFMGNDEYVSITVIQGGIHHQVGLIDNPSGGPDDSVDDMLNGSIDLSAYIGAPAELRFLTSPNMHRNSGTYIDNITIEGCSL